MPELALDPNDIFSIQFQRRLGKDGALVRYAPGEEVLYQRMDASLPSERRTIVAQEIYDLLEKPSFSVQSQQMPYSAEIIEKLMAVEGGVTLLAWQQGKEKSQLVGYIIGGPYKNYPEELKAVSSDVTTTDGNVLPLPDDATWIADTSAVAASQRGKRIGGELFDLMMEECTKFSGCTKLAAFLVQHETSKSPQMLNSHPVLAKAASEGRLVSGIVPYRGLVAEYRLYDLQVAGNAAV